MADNYLEKKYEQYQARKTSGTRTSHNTKTLHKTRRVFITGGAEGIGKAIVRTFRGAGHRVAFCDKNEASGKETALQTGTQFFPVDVSDKTALEDCQQKIIEDQISAAADILRQGGLVGIHTETVYGLGAHALDADPVNKIL